ncbi:MAG: GNAT family N-acetyltransferase [Terriglobales bacterium]
MNASVMPVTSQDEVSIPASTLRCELITDFCRLEALSADWDRLWRADPDGEIFQSFGWARAWWRCYADTVALCSLAVFEGERLIGIVPLVRDRDRIVFLGGRHADYCDLLCERGRGAEVFETGLEALLQLPDWKECVLRNLKTDSQALVQSAKLPARLRRYVQRVPGEDCYTILLGENGDGLGSLIGKGHTKRRLNKLRKAGALTFRHIETKAEAQAQLSAFFLHQVRRRVLAGKDSPAPELCTFLRNLIDELDLTRELRFGVLELNDRPLAWHLSFHLNGKLLFYQQTFDVDAWDYSPGEVLIHELLGYARENVTREVDFTRGNEPFKDRFTTHTRESYSLYIERSGIGGQLRRVLRGSMTPGLRLGRHAQRVAKRRDLTFHRFRSLRLWASGILARIRYYRQKGTLIIWAGNNIARWFRSLRLRKTHIDFIPPCKRNGYAMSSPVASNSSVTARKGGLGDLVDITLQHPEIVVPSELAKYRQRLKKGDQVYLVWQGEEVVLIGWTTTPGPDELLRSSGGQKLPCCSPLMLMYECSPISNAVEKSFCRQLLGAVRKEAEKKELALGVCCPDPLPADSLAE